MATVASPQFKRKHHQLVAKLLRAFDPSILLQTECFFGGGTAIALSLDEYRESVDIDFLCSSRDGFRFLRNAVGSDLGPLLRVPVAHARGVTSNQYKILTYLEIEGVKVKVEIIREGNTTLQGEMDPALGVPVLSRTDLWAQKLMANADRALDKSCMSRDIIDLGMMLRGWGPLPEEAFDKAFAAYGDSVSRGFNHAFRVISDRSYLADAMSRMGMDLALADVLIDAVDEASAALPVEASEKSEYERRVLLFLESKDRVPFFLQNAFAEFKSGPGGSTVNWAQIERKAFLDAVVDQGIEPQDVIEAFSSFSPAASSSTRMQAVATRLTYQAERLQLFGRDAQPVDSDSPKPG